MKKRMRVGLLLCVLLLVAGCTGTGSGAGESTPTFHNGLTVGSTHYKDVINGSKVINIAVTMDQGNLTALRNDPGASDYYSAAIKIGNDPTIENVGFRTKGNTAFTNVSDASLQRYSYKVKFDEFVDKQKYNKLDEMVLMNLYKDPSYMREYLALEVLREMGAKVPLVSFATLTINGEAAGLYLCVEAIEDGFLNRVFGNNDGNLYKAEIDSTLLNETSLTTLEQKNGKDETKASLSELITKLHAMPAGEKGEIESILDVNSVLLYAAANAMMGAYDSYSGKDADNYYLCENDGIFTLIPWDYHLAFGASGKDNGASATVSLEEPVFRTTFAQRPLISKLLAVEEYKTRYYDYVNRLKNILAGLDERIQAIDQQIGTLVAQDGTTFYGYENYLASLGREGYTDGTGIISIREYVAQRLASLPS